MSILLDSPILLQHHQERGPLPHPPSLDSEDEFYISIITADELLRGINSAPDSTQRTKRLAYVEAVLDTFPIIPIDRSIVRIHADILMNLKRKKNGLSLTESWIAATCIAYGLVLFTDEPRTFKPIDGLLIQSIE